MRLFNLFFALGAIMGVVIADGSNPILTPGSGDNVYAGKTLSITWTATTPGPVTLTLRFGSTNSLSSSTVVAKSIKNSGSFSWNVPTDFGSGFYTVEISDDKTGQANYSPLFSVSGGTGIQTAATTLTNTAGSSGTTTAAFSTNSATSAASAIREPGLRHAYGPLAAVMGVGALIAVS